MPLRKFLFVGCGGSGGAALRYLMDQLRADLRPLGIHAIPDAWQFVHIDATATADVGPGTLGSITDLGGRYVPVSAPTNSYLATWSSVSAKLQANDSLASLLGWVPRDPRRANNVPVTDGAGQYRAIGRMLSLPYLRTMHEQFDAAFRALQQPNAWGDLPPSLHSGNEAVIPVVVSSMAGGAGAGLFLDACRVLGKLPGIDPANLGLFLFTADVFGELPEHARSGVEGNALGALGEIIAASARTGEDVEVDLHAALGLPQTGFTSAPFARVFPIGALVGGDGAVFGDGTMHGIYRGLGRALAGVVMSERATENYVDRMLANRSPADTDIRHLGWAQNPGDFTWGSLGYASVSLGRDRYEEYAAQRTARLAVDHLVAGHRDPASQLPDTEQLGTLVEGQWSYILNRTGFGAPGQPIPQWFRSEAYPDVAAEQAARVALAGLLNRVAVESGPATGWLATTKARAHAARSEVTQIAADQVYTWANDWAARLENSALDEFAEGMARYGLPYAREVVARLRRHCERVGEAMAQAGAVDVDPLALDPSIETRALQLGNSDVTPGHPLGGLVSAGLLDSTQSFCRRHAARVGAQVLASFAHDVLPALESAASDALLDLEHAITRAPSQAGLAQVASTTYKDWPGAGDRPPARFDEAVNEVLVTTSAEFPAQYVADLQASVPTAVGVYSDAVAQVRYDVLRGRWETTGGRTGDVPVLTRTARWRPQVLGYDPVTRTPTPATRPRYLAATSTADVLGRARQWLARPGQPFTRFARQSLGDYLNDPQIAAAQRADRQQRFVRSFGEAMALARPLVGVSPQMVRAVHSGQDVRYDYSFSEIGLADSDPTAAAILQRLRTDSQLDATTVTAFTEALSTTDQSPGSGSTRIAVFGAYQKYSPLVFASLLRPVQQRWQASSAEYLRQIWQWKRARPLSASIAMSDDELVATSAGWYLGRALGLVQHPSSARETGPVRVFDVSTRRWLTFGPLLVSLDRSLLSGHDWMPAVLGSHALAVVQCNEDPTLAALAPYRAVRELYDSAPDHPTRGGADLLAATELIAAWYRTGEWPSGEPSTIMPSDTGSADERQAALVDWLTRLRDGYTDSYLDPGLGARPSVPTVESACDGPLILELATTAVTALDALIVCAQSASRAGAAWARRTGPDIDV